MQFCSTTKWVFHYQAGMHECKKWCVIKSNSLYWAIDSISSKPCPTLKGRSRFASLDLIGKMPLLQPDWRLASLQITFGTPTQNHFLINSKWPSTIFMLCYDNSTSEIIVLGGSYHYKKEAIYPIWQCWHLTFLTLDILEICIYL